MIRTTMQQQDQNPMSPNCIVVMGVSGSGKTSVGRDLAQKLSAKFFDGDDLHQRSSIEKMASGLPLDDLDRVPWLERINDVVFALNHKNERGVIVCSALKKSYRDCIRDRNQGIIFFFLKASLDVIRPRLEARSNHYMPSQLLQSQFDVLEVPNQSEPDVVSIDADSSTVEELVSQCCNVLANCEALPARPSDDV
ncbi:hypothetical protein BGZ83_008558 [Gryganskiella cystojenkinii]|nr:hypothetical protein BGZ83_008558 [Gryganskiella cystojenkinii]